MATHVNCFGGIVSTSGMTNSQVIDFIVDKLVTLGGFVLVDRVSTTSAAFKLQLHPKHAPVYFNIYISGTNFVVSPFYKYWNATTHAGSYYIPGDSNNVSFSAGFFYLFACPGCFFLSQSAAVSVVSYTYGFLSSLSTLYPNSAAFVSAEAAAGSGVVVSVDDSSNFLPGMTVAYATELGAWGKGTIISVNSSTSITLSTVSFTLPSGSFVFVPPAISHWNNGHNGHLHAFCDQSLNGAANVGSPLSRAPFSSFSVVSYDDVLGRTMPGPLTVYGNRSFGVIDNDALLMSDTALTVNNFLVLDSLGFTPVSGTATGGTTSSIVDTSKSFVENALAGKYIAISGGTNAGACVKVLSNTSNTIVFDKALPSACNTSTQYVVSDIVYRAISSTILTRESL